MMTDSVVVVDDEVNIVELLCSMLTKRGIETTGYCHSDEALTAIQNGLAPDLFILDMMMPKVTGFDLLETILASPACQDVPVVFLSARDSDKERVFALEHGAVDYLRKPCHLPELFAHVDVQLRLRRKDKELRRLNKELAKRATAAEGKLDEAQTRILVSEKLSALGQLSAGVAHEINNPMSFVYSNLRILKRYFNDLGQILTLYRKRLDEHNLRDEVILTAEENAKLDRLLADVPNLINESFDGAQRIKAIVQNMKSFAHPGTGQATVCDINEMIRETVRIAHNEIKYKGTVELDLGKIPPVEAFRQELNQVFLNLLVNAADALGKEGKIVIATRHSDSKLAITFSDNGSGIPPENLNRIFDPFFTTKDVGKGTGLGLPLCHNIIENHQGRIDVESTVGTGTTFRIELPLQRGSA